MNGLTRALGSLAISAALGLGIGACGGSAEQTYAENVDTSVDIEGRVGGNESVELGDINTGVK